MTNRYYKDNFSGVRSFDGWDVLNADDLRKLRQDIRQRLQESGSYILDGTNRKATVTETEEGPVLTSYYTEVAAIIRGRLVRLWDGWSATTAKHVRTFCHRYGIDAPSKREWFELPTA